MEKISSLNCQVNIFQLQFNVKVNCVEIILVPWQIHAKYLIMKIQKDRIRHSLNAEVLKYRSHQLHDSEGNNKLCN